MQNVICFKNTRVDDIAELFDCSQLLENRIFEQCHKNVNLGPVKWLVFCELEIGAHVRVRVIRISIYLFESVNSTVTEANCSRHWNDLPVNARELN